MQTRLVRRRFRSVLTLSLVQFSLLVSSLEAATVSWVASSGDWNTPANWSTGALPGPDDDVVMDVPALITVTHSSGAHSVKSLHHRKAIVPRGNSGRPQRKLILRIDMQHPDGRPPEGRPAGQIDALPLEMLLP